MSIVCRLGAVDCFAAVEDGGGAIVMKKGDGLAGGVYLGESLSGFFARSCEHDGGGYEEGKECVDGDGGASDPFKAPCEVSVEKGCQYRKGEESGKGVGGILGGDEFEACIDGKIQSGKISGRDVAAPGVDGKSVGVSGRFEAGERARELSYPIVLGGSERL